MLRQILIVDESAAMRHLLAVVCARIGNVEIAQAEDGLDALKRLATGRYDLIFVDLNMPVLDGRKLIQRIRTSPEHSRAPICVVTTEAEAEDQVRQLGADHFLRKPVQRRDVEHVLCEVFPTDNLLTAPGQPE
jgi:two-component system chemotaxis response regulator CheY